ncbi:MAG: UDP-N-acetylenolpyruvoylglucosamine reductase [Candidatus Woesebacteria bacterium GW2011_GWA1_40_43]|uniref:UDP-N-acetylenolpyruvoylglucosamine reductase n=1 Tax=Candidatus Woesebacteria bacterium GW2011_GWA1_40_43 TaxID=1618553 RepID=A0A0G0VPF5_9BACT|nr:MAG: UDP-N-acetylenolpyruvoylglucosamine reductase [Candidatus Woesebacteria bacterium GW2011_GWD2_40_19]KKR58481.1 MAG: UDP-N-acetylenolpyruvoylglucosamine reductase [Candidatus Woesebacteria bacterium GW2011_GWC2_40_30]KKR64622.1 MAG: UDP-N-acetylenolpyruvoylglucosamine reductase [Candidatus Woesebacteria bacterium GW2011_GWA1_40_43]HAU65373.1 UDP-N-acetylenolpyruvoylglucosamine reductase [Candidatus Woesebacteria bacterium]
MGQGDCRVDIISSMKIIEDKKFKDLTTFRIGGKIKYYVEVKSEGEIREMIRFAKTNNLPIFIVGDGSDFLASDRKYEGLVIKYTGDGLKFEVQDSEVFVTAGAGLNWDKLVEETVKRNLQGLECLSGVPGTAGAAPIQNMGAYGQEVADTFYKLEAYDIQNEEHKTFTKEDCKFGYRESVFKDKENWQKYLIISVTFKLSKDGKPNTSYESLKNSVGEGATLQEVRKAVLKTRKEKLEDPKEVGNAGSFFKNPVIDVDEKVRIEKEFADAKIFPFKNMYKVSAAWMIERAGWKGKSEDGVAVSPKHALILINKSGYASAEDVYKLSEMIIKDVSEKFGVKLEREVQLINF